jgi:hypothetical protein
MNTIRGTVASQPNDQPKGGFMFTLRVADQDMQCVTISEFKGDKPKKGSEVLVTGKHGASFNDIPAPFLVVEIETPD